jgi:hypothetical protein
MRLRGMAIQASDRWHLWHGLAGTRQSRSCGLKQLERALRVSGVATVSGGPDLATLPGPG